MPSQLHIDPPPTRAPARALALALLLSACAGAAAPASIPANPPVSASDAGADAALGPAPIDASHLVDSTPATTTAALLPTAAGPVFQGSDGTCWEQERITCATNTDCKLPPHRQVACPPAGD